MKNGFLTLGHVVVGTVLLLTLVVFFVIPDWLDEARQPFRSPLNDVEHHLLSGTMQALTTALDTANVTYFIIAGTLLGSYRYHDRIPWDDDVDLIVPMSEQSELKVTVSSLEPDYRLLSDFPVGYHWKFYLSSPLPGSHRPWFGMWSAGWPFVDIFFYEQNATHVWNTCPWYADEVWPLRTVFPLRRRPFGNLSLPAPCDAAATLAVNFDLKRCRSRRYDHLRNSPLWLGLRGPVEVDCASLETMWPFVRRRRWIDESGTRLATETLWSAGGQHALQEITLIDQCR